MLEDFKLTLSLSSRAVQVVGPCSEHVVHVFSLEQKAKDIFTDTLASEYSVIQETGFTAQAVIHVV